MRSRVKKCRSRSRNAGHMLQDAGQLEQNAVTHLRLSSVSRVQVERCGLRVARCKLRFAKCRGIGEFYGVLLYLCNSFVLSGIDFIFGMVLV